MDIDYIDTKSDDDPINTDYENNPKPESDSEPQFIKSIRVDAQLVINLSKTKNRPIKQKPKRRKIRLSLPFDNNTPIGCLEDYLSIINS